jgi:hypothetical protein
VLTGRKREQIAAVVCEHARRYVVVSMQKEEPVGLERLAVLAHRSTEAHAE